MENINGALAYVASLDINDFNVSAEAMEQHIRKASTGIQAEAADMEQSLMDFAQKGAMYIQAYLVGQGMTGLLQSIVQVRGQFQQLEIAFGTMLGSESQAKALMDQMIETAAKTPFDLMGVAAGAKQLLAYGTAADKVNDTLIRLGNIASGLSIPLNDIVYLYGTTMVQGRLYAQDVRQFTGRGIPLVKELAKMYGVTAEEINNMVSAGKIGFADVEKVLNGMTDEGGQFFNLMEKQSASLTGMISNLEDAWDSMLNDIGTANQGVFADAISSATYLVEHYQDILDILKAVTLAYGSYKAAIVLNTIATKGYTGVALIDNTYRQAKLALMKAEAVATGQVAAQTKAMTAAQEAHVAALEKELTTEELANMKKQLRIATIQSLLTAQQAEYLSNLGLTTSSEGYEAAALQVMNVEQQQAVQKLDLTSKSAVYRAALEQEVAAKRGNAQAAREQAQAELEAMRVEVSASAKRMESAKQAAVVAMQKVEAARYELYWTRQNGDATAIATAQKKLEGAQENQAIARKAALAASTEFYSKKKALEVAATRQSIVASTQDATAKGVQTAATNLLSSATHKATLAIKTLWATMKANPLGWILTIVGLVASAFSLFSKNEKEANDVMGEFQKSTSDEINKLNLYMSVLHGATNGTKTHKDAVDKINAICKEYNKTLLDENATLDEQKAKYEELKTAIQATTAEKIKAKYTEQALKDMTDAQTKAYNDLVEAAGRAKVASTTARGDLVYKENEAIQSGTKAMWAAVHEMALNEADELKTLTGDAYDQAFKESLGRIINWVRESTKANDTEISNFSSHIENYFDIIVSETQKAQSGIETLNKQVERMYNKKPDPTPIVESTNYVEMSFEDLEAKINEVQAEIDNLNVQIINPQTDPTQLDGLKTRLMELINLKNELNNAIETKTANLNTDAGISARIKELRELIATEEYGSEQRKKHTQELLALQSRMDANNGTRGNGGGRGNTKEQQLRDAEAYAQKQLEAQRKLDEARIEVMEEGYAKRKATLDLQHQLALEQIDKEERELEKARQKAGKGSKGMQTHESTNIRGAGADLWRDVEAKAKDGLQRLSGLTGQAYTETYNQVMESMVGAIRNATNASGAEIDAFKPKLKEYLDAYVRAASDASAEAGEMGNAMEAQAVYLDRLARAASTATYQTYGLTEAERALFQERRKLANQEYTTESTKLFDGEIEYKRKQYEAYFQWVRNVGQDVADTHFRTLIAEGSSFTAWINKQIADLEAKRSANPGSFTQGDANALNALRMQQNEITGAKSAMDLFKESVSRAVNQAQTLAEKLQAIADLKERLANGEFHLNQDETAAASYQLNQQDSDLSKQVTDEVLNNYKTFEEQKLAITRQYQLLRNEAEKLGLSERVAMINQGEAEALSALNAQMLMQTESWKNLFSDLDSLTVEQIEKLIKEIQDKMSTADLKLNPSDMKAVLDKLDEAKKKVLDTNPFKALGTALSSVFKKQQDGSKKTSQQIKRDWKNLGDATKDCFDFVDDAISSCSVLDDIVGDTGKAMISTLSGIATAGIAMSSAIKTAEKGSAILAAISIALQAIDFIAGLFNNDDELEEHIQSIQRDIDALQSSLNRLQNAYDHTYWVFNDEEEAAYQTRVNAIKDQIKTLEKEAELARTVWNFSKYAELTKQIKDLSYELEKAQRSGDMYDLMQLQTDNLRKQQEMIRQQIEDEKDKKDTDWDKISQWEEKIKDIDTQIEDIERSMMETLAGTDVKSAIDGFADALTEAFAQGEDAAEALGQKTKEVLKNAVVEALKRQFLAKGINDAVQYLGEAMKDNVLSDSERATFEAMVNQAGTMYKNAMEGVADLIKDVEETDVDALTGAVQGMSEETGGVVAGRLNAVVINQGQQITLLSEFFRWVRENHLNLSQDEVIAAIRQMNGEPSVGNPGSEETGGVVAGRLNGNRLTISTPELNELMRQSLLYQAEIADNTRYCKRLDEIAADVKKISNSGNPLLAQGIS